MTGRQRIGSLRDRLIAFARAVLRLPRSNQRDETPELAQTEDIAELEKWANAPELKPPE